MSEQPEDIVCSGGIGLPGLGMSQPDPEQVEEVESNGSDSTGV
jgi:hypothetical protein